MTDNLNKVRLFMVVRVITVTALLMSAFLVELWFQPARSLRPLYLFTAATYALTILYGLLYAVMRERPAFVYLQLAGDILTTSGFVHVTGNVSSPFSFLYVAVIISGGVLLYRRGAYVVAGLACLAYVTLIGLILSEILPAYPPGSLQATSQDLKRASISILVHVLGFCLVGMLSSILSESLRRAGQALGEVRENLEDLQAFNALIIDSVNSGLVTTDTAGRITFLNRAAREITGLSLNAARGRSVQEVFALPESFIPSLDQALLHTRRHRFEAELHLTATAIRTLGFTAGVLRDKGDQPLGFIFTFQDLTEIKSLEREILVRERMAAVGEMAAGMAHELRNPLASISGSVQVLGSAVPDERPEQRDLLGIIRRESLRLDQVLTDFLAFARPRPVQLETADLVPLLEELAVLARNAPGVLAGHEIVTSFSARSLRCPIDVNRLKQVFWNLTSNALRAMPDGGRLTVTAGRGSGGEIVIAFEDEGRGMTADEIKDYFRPFRSRFEGGTGLGAAIVYRIVEEHGGRIQVDSAPGRGTRIRVALPATAVERPAGSEEREWQETASRAS
jgi:two-component system sensor histidine kinase PilS (NtrC family)